MGYVHILSALHFVHFKVYDASRPPGNENTNTQNYKYHVQISEKTVTFKKNQTKQLGLIHCSWM